MVSENDLPQANFSRDDLRRFFRYELSEDDPLYKAILQDGFDNPETGAIWKYTDELRASGEYDEFGLDVNWKELFACLDDTRHNTKSLLEGQNDSDSATESSDES